MEVYEIIQYCEKLSDSGAYDKELFIQALTDLPKEQLNLFLREYLHLLEFYHSTKNFYVADDIEFIKQHPSFLLKIEPINFESPVNFVRRK